MSFANNCFGLCNSEKTISFLTPSVSTRSFRFSGYIVVFVSHFSSERPSNLIIKKSSQYNYLFRFYYFYSVFNEHLPYPPQRMVGSSGLEPPTSCLSGTRSNHLSYEPSFFSVGPVGGGDDGIRTHDPLLAGQVLSQLSYTPIRCSLYFAASRTHF